MVSVAFVHDSVIICSVQAILDAHHDSVSISDASAQLLDILNLILIRP